jgi:hypothetical protein
VRTADVSNTYTAQGNEFDPDTIFNPCNEELTIVNDYNNLETLAGEVFAPGNYTITWNVYDSEGMLIDNCSFNIEIDLYTKVSTQSENEIKIYPNPSNDFIIVTVPESLSVTKVEITDINGRVVLKTVGSGRKVKVDIGSYEPGVYTITVSTNETVYAGKIVKK